MSPTQDKPPAASDVLLDGDQVLTQADIIELGLEEAPQEAGPCFEEMAAAQQGRPDHG